MNRNTTLRLLTLVAMIGLFSVIASAQLPPVYKDPNAALRSAKMIHVKSTSLLVGVPVIEAKLQKRSEFSQLCLVLTRDVEEADLILVVEHDVFTKYTYTAIHKDTNIVVASGKLSSLGGTVAGKVAKRFLKQVVKARGSTSPGCGPKEGATSNSFPIGLRRPSDRPYVDPLKDRVVRKSGRSSGSREPKIT